MLKTIITRKSDNVITGIVDNNTKEVSNGLLVHDATGEYIIGCINECSIFKDVEILDTIEVQKYLYTAENGFVVNSNYKPYVSDQEKIANLEKAVIS